MDDSDTSQHTDPTTRDDTTGMHRHPETITMETTGKGQQEKRNGHLPRNAGACPVKLEPNEQNIPERNTKNKVQEREAEKK
jgi:hypothetical protein